MDEIKDEFVKEFGKFDSNRNYIIEIIKNSCSIIQKQRLGIFEPLKDFYKIWLLNNHKYQYFISRMIGIKMGLYNFNNDYSNLMQNKIYDIDITNIDKNLRDCGVYICDFKIPNSICLNIKNSIRDKYFKPFDTNIAVLGDKIIDKNVMYNGSSTYWIQNQDDILSSQDVSNIATDPFFLKIAQNYLGCNPILCQTNLWYSCTNTVPERTQQFHQDYDDINFLKIFIYLSDVNMLNGPHSYVSGSLNNLITPSNYEPSNRLTDDYVINTYGENVKIFTGVTGTIIIENTNGLHRGLPVLSGSRLILQLQYSSTLLPFQQGCSLSKLERTEYMEKYPDCFPKKNKIFY